jgi:hypothetical protein
VEAETSVHFMNINEDPILTGYVRNIMRNGDNKIGSKVDEGTGFRLNGLGIGDIHSVVTLSGGSVYL